ncbi:MAG: SoxR reducing system RseC family protein [Bacteroidales bacterium]|nr:SoxR reducing system RseC family protein [Bacteroidales bacterium]MCD8394229.1 SoxR reducing system RseC family protein [Bacteroidales bacterium]
MEIEHQAIVKRVEPDGITVAIISSERCGGCAAAVLCGASQSLEQKVEVLHPEEFTVGERVSVTSTEPSQVRAVWLGIGIPCVLFLLVIFGLLALRMSQGWAALGGLLILVPYYLILYRYRKRITRRLQWIVKPLPSSKLP